jgi:hypothetical protein
VQRASFAKTSVFFQHAVPADTGITGKVWPLDEQKRYESVHGETAPPDERSACKKEKG